jgi:hypothetical protein
VTRSVSFTVFVGIVFRVSDLKEEVQVAGSRDDVMRFVELIAFENSINVINKVMQLMSYA